MTAPLHQAARALLEDCETTDDGRVSVPMVAMEALRAALDGQGQSEPAHCSHSCPCCAKHDAPQTGEPCPNCKGRGSEAPGIICDSCRGTGRKVRPWRAACSRCAVNLQHEGPCDGVEDASRQQTGEPVAWLCQHGTFNMVEADGCAAGGCEWRPLFAAPAEGRHCPGCESFNVLPAKYGADPKQLNVCPGIGGRP